MGTTTAACLDMRASPLFVKWVVASVTCRGASCVPAAAFAIRMLRRPHASTEREKFSEGGRNDGLGPPFRPEGPRYDLADLEEPFPRILLEPVQALAESAHVIAVGPETGAELRPCHGSGDGRPRPGSGRVRRHRGGAAGIPQVVDED